MLPTTGFPFTMQQELLPSLVLRTLQLHITVMPPQYTEGQELFLNIIKGFKIPNGGMLLYY